MLKPRSSRNLMNGRNFSAMAATPILKSIAVIVLLIHFLYFLHWAGQKKTQFSDGWYILAASEGIKQPVSCMISLRERRGRLGNRLFMFATALGLALTHSCYLSISTHIFQELNQSFHLHLPRVASIQSGLNRSEPEEKLYNYCSYLTSLFRSNNTAHTIELTGFWQVHRYFSPHASKIRRQLRFRSTILDRVNRFLRKHIRGNDAVTRVGIHIRRGDFVGARDVSDERYVLAAMSYFTRKYRSVVFVIVTDDRAYCNDAYGKMQNVFFTPPSFDAPLDLATLSRCDHVIITVGTFGWWGAFLLHDRTGGVLTDAKADHTPIDNHYQGDLYFPPWFSFLDNKTR